MEADDEDYFKNTSSKSKFSSKKKGGVSAAKNKKKPARPGWNFDVEPLEEVEKSEDTFVGGGGGHKLPLEDNNVRYNAKTPTNDAFWEVDQHEKEEQIEAFID